MPPHDVAAFYRDNPRMVSSPFGGIDGYQGDLLQRVWRQLGIDPAGRRVLDVGCGRGFAGEVVRAAGGDYTGVDVVVPRGGFPLARGDAQALPFAREAFDLVCCFDAFEHFPDPAAAAREWARVLRPGGCIFLSAPNYGNIAGWVKQRQEASGAYARDTWAPFGRWQPQALEQMVTPAYVRRAFRAGGFTQFEAIGFAREVELGLCPWLDHPRTPERIRLRAQPLLRALGPAIVRVWPGASLHLFWRIAR